MMVLNFLLFALARFNLRLATKAPPQLFDAKRTNSYEDAAIDDTRSKNRYRDGKLGMLRQLSFFDNEHCNLHITAFSLFNIEFFDTMSRKHYSLETMRVLTGNF